MYPNQVMQKPLVLLWHSLCKICEEIRTNSKLEIVWTISGRRLRMIFFLECAEELRVISLIDRRKGPITCQFHGWGYV